MANKCLHCGGELEAKRSTKKFCCEAHKVAYGRKVSVTVKPLSVTDTRESQGKTPYCGSETLEQSIRELEKAGD